MHKVVTKMVSFQDLLVLHQELKAASLNTFDYNRSFKKIKSLR